MITATCSPALWPAGTTAKEGHVMHRLSNLMPALVLIRIGQELGTNSPAARAVHDLLELLSAVPWKILGSP